MSQRHFPFLVVRRRSLAASRCNGTWAPTTQRPQSEIEECQFTETVGTSPRPRAGCAPRGPAATFRDVVHETCGESTGALARSFGMPEDIRDVPAEQYWDTFESKWTSLLSYR